jgi:two-component system sensor histidine kinase AlgZ
MGILSGFHSKKAQAGAALDINQRSALMFNNCQAGMVFRAVALVHGFVAVSLLFLNLSALQWLQQVALVSWVTLPATLVWLILGCSSRRWLYGKSYAFQFSYGLALGAVLGWASAKGISALPIASLANPQPLASSAAGAFLAALLIWLASLRRNAVAPENTTAQLKQLQARIQPHFLFNSLNSAIALVKLEPEKAEILLQDLSDLFHHAISKSNTVLTLEEELTLVRQYLDIEKIRFESRMEIHWRIDANTLETKIVPLMLQPLVENAVKHGIEPNLEPGHIWIETRTLERVVEIRIENSIGRAGAMMPKKPSTGIGLRNVATRLQLFYDTEATIDTRVANGRYRVLVRIPRKPALVLTDNHSTFF